MSARFDQNPDEPYGFCLTCKDAGIDLPFADQPAMSAHLSETFEAGGRVNGKGHSGRVTNATREERIRRHMGSLVDDALYDFLESVERDVERGDLTEDEVGPGLVYYSDFRDAWDNREES
jgi:hypothetical protein